MGGHWWSRNWSDRPWWAKRTDIVNFSIVGILLLIMLWEVIQRWLGR